MFAKAALKKSRSCKQNGDLSPVQTEDKASERKNSGACFFIVFYQMNEKTLSKFEKHEVIAFALAMILDNFSHLVKSYSGLTT